MLFDCIWPFIYSKEEYEKYLYMRYHVPTFIFLAFYFYYPILACRNINKIISRFQRLLIPYIIWPSLIFILHNISSKAFKLKRFEGKLPIKYLYLQILIGTPYYRIFWFQFNIIFLSLYFSIIALMFKNYFLEIIKLSGVISLFLNISKISLNIFNSMHEIIGENLGSLVELMPLASIGCVFNSFDFIRKIQNISISNRLILLSLLFIFFKYDIFIKLKGFRYPNVFINILVSILLFLNFVSIHLFNSKLINIVISQITQYTGGIYYLHVIIGVYLSKYLTFVKNRTYFSSIFIYIICYFICLFGHKLFKNNNLKYLFI